MIVIVMVMVMAGAILRWREAREERATNRPYDDGLDMGMEGSDSIDS